MARKANTKAKPVTPTEDRGMRENERTLALADIQMIAEELVRQKRLLVQEKTQLNSLADWHASGHDVPPMCPSKSPAFQGCILDICAKQARITCLEIRLAGLCFAAGVTVPSIVVGAPM